MFNMKKMLEKELGQRVRVIRESKKPKMTQANLAEKAELSTVTINNLENGKIPNVSIDTVLRVAQALGVTSTVLTGEIELNYEALKAIDALRSLFDTERRKEETEHISKKKKRILRA